MIGLDFEDVWLTSADGVRLHAWWVPAAAPRTTLLFLHGNQTPRQFTAQGLVVLAHSDTRPLQPFSSHCRRGDRKPPAGRREKA